MQTAELLGQKIFALRAWLDPKKLAAFGLTAADVSQALTANDYISGIGNTKGQMVQVNLTASTSLHSAEQFRNLVLKQTGGAVVRLKDVANVTLGAEDYESEVGFDGKQAVYIGIQVAPTANLLDVIAGVHKVFPEIQALLPHGLHGEIIYDSTEFVNSSIHEVIRSLAEALVIVTVVVFLVPRLGALLHHSDRGHSAVAGRHAHHAVGARLLDQPADAPGAGAGHRACGRRRHHRCRERQSPSRGGRWRRSTAALDGGARTGRADHRDDRGAGRGLRADRLSKRTDRRAVFRIRLRAGRRRHRVRHRRADAFADAVLAAAQAA